jgi:hypothetical protein
MGVILVLGFSAIRRRDIAAHRAWMIRAYALGLGAGTQIFTESFGEAALGTGDVSKAVSLSAGWIVNAVVAEWVIRRPVHRRRRSARNALAPLPSEPSSETSTEERPLSSPEENQRYVLSTTTAPDSRPTSSTSTPLRTCVDR